MRELSIREIRDALTNLDELIAREGEIVLTRRGRKIARILPMSGARRLPSRRRLRGMMPRMTVPSDAIVSADRDER